MKWRWHIVALVILAFSIRCVELYTSGKWRRPLMMEPTEQVLIAQGIADGQGFITPFRHDGHYVQDPSAYSPPAYPYLLAGILTAGRWCALDDMVSYRIALLISVFAASMTVGFLAWAGGVLNGRLGFWCAGLMASFWPSLVTNATALWDTPFTVVAIGMAVCVAVTPRTRTPSPTWSLGAGLLSGIFMLFNPLVSSFCLAALAARYFVGIPIVKKSLFAFMLVLSAWVISVAPWMVRNALVFERLIPVRNTFGFTLWVGNQPGADGRATSTYLSQIGANAEERRKLWESGEDTYMRLKTAEAVKIIRADPRAFWRRTVERFTLYWTGDLRNQTIILGMAFPMIGEVNVLKGILNIGFILCAMAGTMCWGRYPGRWVCWFGLLFLPLPYYLTHYSSNYRVFVDPILCLMAAVFISRMSAKWPLRKPLSASPS